jgi:predicted nucleic acid-binding Zn ribbon protein
VRQKENRRRRRRTMLESYAVWIVLLLLFGWMNRDLDF